MTKKRNYGYYEALDLDWLNKHPDAPVMFKVARHKPVWVWAFLLGAVLLIIIGIVRLFGG